MISRTLIAGTKSKKKKQKKIMAWQKE